jgi:hypothetical protein
MLLRRVADAGRMPGLTLVGVGASRSSRVATLTGWQLPLGCRDQCVLGATLQRSVAVMTWIANSPLSAITVSRRAPACKGACGSRGGCVAPPKLGCLQTERTADESNH